MPSLDYIRIVQAASRNMVPILQREMATIQQNGGSLFDFGCFAIALQTITQLGESAEQIEQKMVGLVVAQNPGLVGPDGQPISRQARRQIKRKVDKGV
jgi:hypothetical protein